MDEKVDPNKLSVHVITPQRRLFEGECQSISSVNLLGPFDILPQHENFISIIHDYVIVRTKNENKKFELKEAVLKAEANSIYVFIGIDSVV